MLFSCVCTASLVKFERAIRTRADRGDLFWYLLGLRLFPATPNWLLNLISPLLGVPYVPFVMSVLIGLAPYNYLCTGAGSVLSTLTSVSDIFNAATLAKMGAMAVVAVLPTFLRSKLDDPPAALLAAVVSDSDKKRK